MLKNTVPIITVKRDSKNRVPLIDEVRGFAIICMVVYHFFFDLVVLFSVDIPLFHTDFIQTLVMIFAGSFIFISGSACLFSRNNLKRGAICFGLGLAVSLVTYLVMPTVLDLFGILHMLGICMMLFALVAPLVKKIPPVIGIIASFLLFFITYNLQAGYLGVGMFSVELPQALYSTPFLFPLGLPNNSFFSSDYFPLFPWFFCFMAGSFFGVLVKEHRLPNFFYKDHLKFLSFTGRYTIWIYLAHQPVLYGVLYLVFSAINS